MKRQKVQNGARAFTLTELLVVVAVLAAMACLMIPARAGVKGQTAVAQCSDNIRLYCLALQSSAADANDLLPQVSSGNWAWDIPGSVVASLAKYGVERRHFYCPANPDQNSDVLWNFSTYRVTGYATSLAGSSTVIAANQTPALTPQPQLIGIVSLSPYLPSQRVLVADATVCALVSNPSQSNASTYNWTAIPGGAPILHRTSHMNIRTNLPAGGNLGMLDGHVEWRAFGLMSARTGNGSPVFWW